MQGRLFYSRARIMRDPLFALRGVVERLLIVRIV